MKALRNDNVHAFVSYFECAFTGVDVPVGFSTSPRSTYTHWKQTIFYMKDPIYVEEGDEFVGKISCVPNAKNERDLDISIAIKLDGKNSSYEGTLHYMLR